ncbi:MAG: SIS domain-containing protein [Smithella sp.]|nr:SIS domain-containing protein [Smithella sp.]
MVDFTSNIKEYLKLLESRLAALDVARINEIVNVLKSAQDNGNAIFTMGNGGSGTTASHIVCDFNQGASSGMAKKFKVMCLNDNIPSLSAIANDISYDAIFKEQLKNFLRPGDVVIGISVSGNSKNIIKGIEYANKNGATTIGFCGYDGGKLKKTTKYSIHVKCDDMKVTEDIHSIISHIMMKSLGERLKKGTKGARRK